MLKREQLTDFFTKAERQHPHRMGTEQEKFAVFLDDEGVPRPIEYRHIEAIFQELESNSTWRPQEERGLHGEIIGLQRDGASITLEPGGQLELSGAPLKTVHETCGEFTHHRKELDAIGKKLGITFLATGFHPFARRDEINWMPKGRYRIMREYLPTQGQRALDMMLRTCTVQTNLDYANEKDCIERFRLAMAISPMVTAMFANSPLIEGADTGLVSARSRTWTEVDPARCGVPEFVFKENFGYESYVEWALDIPMFFIKRDGEYVGYHKSFREYMNKGFVDEQGRAREATYADWTLHLNTLFPEVRLNPFIEIRGADSVGTFSICTLPALSKGLIYESDAAGEAWELVKDFSYAERLELWAEARTQGLASDRMRKLSLQLVQLARRGLDRLDVQDSRGRSESHFLDPLEETLNAGRPLAELALEKLQTGVDKEARLSQVRAFFYAGAEV